MSPCRCILIAALFLTLNNLALPAQGERIILYLKSGEQMAGELHLVNDSSLVFDKREVGIPQRTEIKLQEIAKVTFKKNPKVALLLNDGRRVTGGLHEVNDSSMVIFNRKLRDKQNYNSAYVEVTSEVKNHEIRQIIIKGKKNAGKGRALGFGLGFLTGAVIGFAEGDDPTCASQIYPSDIWGRFWGEFGCALGEAISPPQSAGDKAMSYGMGLGLGGLTIGWIAGKATSTRDKEMEFSAQQPFAALKSLARFPMGKSKDKR